MSKYVLAGLMAASLILPACQGSEESSQSPGKSGGSATIWTRKTELFIEYPALIVGNEAKFAVHLTWLSNFKPVTEGQLALDFISSDGSRLSVSAVAPTSPGIFRPIAKFEKPGIYRLTLFVNGIEQDTIRVDEMRVFASVSDQATEGESPSAEQLIPFLKEQQWKIDFRTESVARQRIAGSIHAAGEIIPKQNAEAIVAAPFTGYLPAERNENLPVPGTDVVSGSVLAFMMPSAETPGGSEDFASRFAEAETERELTANEYDRAKKLYAIQAISDKEFKETEAEYRRAVATFNALSSYIQAGEDTSHSLEGGFRLKTPISGTVAEVFVVPGKQVNGGEPLFRIINASTVWVRVNVPVTEIGKINKPNKAWMILSGVDDILEINERNGRLISVGSAVDERTRTVPVVFQAQNPQGRLRIGMVGEVNISTGKEHIALVIPEAALTEEEGWYSVYVHVEGEAFVKRDVQLGLRENGRVEVLTGLEEGDRVVTVGAYQVRLASLSSQLPAHGHEH